jgi:hypothetical protein
MASTINAQTTPFAAIVQEADGTGNLALQTANVTALTLDTNQNATFANVVTATTLVGSANASSLTTGTVPTARLATGTANATTFLRGDQTWATAGGGVTSFNTRTGAVTLSTSDVLTATAGAALADIGSYAFLANSGSSTTRGSNYSGSTLGFSSNAGTYFASTTGTWKCMGQTNPNEATVFLRIS